MTTQAAVAPRPYGAFGRSLPFGPVEGWVSVLATVLMVVVVAWSLEDAGWVLNPAGGSFLPWVGVAGFVIGMGGAKIGWGRWRTHFVGALFAGLIIPLIVGGIVLGPDVGWDPQALAYRLDATVEVARNVWNDLVVLGRPITTESNHYHLVFGALVWGAGMLAGYTVFGHRRPLDAIVVLGLVLLANMALSLRGDDQLWMLVVFSSAALLLLIRTHVFEEELTWARRRVGDPSSVGQLYLVAGAQFVIVAVLGSMLLTAAASSAPLQGVWRDLPQHLQSVSAWLQRFAPPGGSFRGPGNVTFGDGAVTSGLWQPSDLIAFRAQFPSFDETPFKWRAGTYSEYLTYGWDWGPTRIESTAANTPLLANAVAGDKPSPTGRTEISVRIIPDAFLGPTILGPNTLLTVDRPTDTIVIGDSGWFTTVEARDASSYSITALIPLLDGEGAITEPQLRLAGTAYADEVKAIYTALPAGALGPAATALLADIRAAVVAPSYADPANPYDLARTMEAYLRDPDNFAYDPDVRDERNALCSGNISSVECFALMKRGYCDYYASTMAVLLRASGVPARVAYGFLPSVRGPEGLEIVGAAAAHYWVEAYFPGTGWIEFDPTGGGVGQPVPIPSGSPPTTTPRPSNLPSSTPGDITPLPIPTGGESTTTTPNSSIGPFVAIGAILIVLAIGLAFAVYRRAPNKPMHPDKAWGSMERLAARAGLGPKPSQTVYEFAGALGDSVPSARIELTTIARAKVEVAYGKRDLPNDSLRRIAIAYHRLRFAIIGFFLRRVLRWRRPRR